MALPSYASPVQRTYYYVYLLICSLVFFFLIAPLVAIIPISFSHSPFMVVRDGMMSIDESYLLNYASTSLFCQLSSFMTIELPRLTSKWFPISPQIVPPRVITRPRSQYLGKWHCPTQEIL